METLDLNKELTLLLEKELGATGKFVLKKQCKDIGIEPEDITIEHLQSLSEKIFNVMKRFVGESKARKICNGILEYRDALDNISSTESSEESHAKTASKQELSNIQSNITVAVKKFNVGLYGDAEIILRKTVESVDELDMTDKFSIQAKARRKLAWVLSHMPDKRDEAMAFFQTSVYYSNEVSDYYEMALAWYGIAGMQWRYGYHESSLKFYKRALTLLRRMPIQSKKERLRRNKAEARIHSGLGNVYLDLEDMSASTKHHELAIQFFKEVENWPETGRVYNNLARVYEEKRDYERAILEYMKGIQYLRKGGGLRMEGWTLTNLASTYIECEKLDEAYQSLEKAELILSQFQDNIAHSKLHCMWGKYFREKEVWTEGIRHFNESLKALEGEEAPDYIAIAQEEFASLYKKKGEGDKAYDLYAAALNWAEKKGEEHRIEKIKAELDELLA